jgi:predicted aconitase
VDILKLTDEEKGMLDGAQGPGAARAMELVCAVGRVYGARRLIPVSSAHISGISYQNIGEHGAAFLREILESVASFAVPATINPCGFDTARAAAWNLDRGFVEGQGEIVKLLVSRGAEPLLTCTPYLAGVRVAPGAHLAWSESSAVSWANSVLGAFTNRCGGPEALASAITGRTAEYGLHLHPNRNPRLRVDVDCPVQGRFGWGRLGWTVGRLAASAVPWIRLPAGHALPSSGELRALAAGMAASGSVALFYLEGATIPVPQDADSEALERAVVDRLEEVPGTATRGDPDLVAFGCPHASLEDLREFAEALRSRKVRKTLWLMTSRHVADRAKEEGTLQILSKAGAEVVCDTCVVSAPLAKLGFRSVALVSSKAACYCPGHCNVDVIHASVRDCLDMAFGEV